MNFLIRRVMPDDADALAHVLVTANNANYRGIVPDQCLTFTEAESAANWKLTLAKPLPPDDCFLIADDGGEVIGYAWGGSSDSDQNYDGQIRQIMVLPEHQRRGVGRALLHAIAQHLIERDISSIRVEVLACNPNRRFYEHMGAEYVSEWPFNWDGVAMTMCRYGWKDTEKLLPH